MNMTGKSAAGALAVSLVCAGTLVGLAPVAAADPVDGMYAATITQVTPPNPVAIGKAMTVIFSSCGPTCTKLLSDSNTAFFGDLQQQGNLWIGSVTSGVNGGVCTGTLDGGALSLILDCPAEPLNVHYALTRK
jgi:hypothetical protein